MSFFDKKADGVEEKSVKVNNENKGLSEGLLKIEPDAANLDKPNEQKLADSVKVEEQKKAENEKKPDLGAKIEMTNADSTIVAEIIPPPPKIDA